MISKFNANFGSIILFADQNARANQLHKLCFSTSKKLILENDFSSLMNERTYKKDFSIWISVGLVD